MHHELGAREFRKAAALGHEFIESSVFDHAAVVKYQNAGRVADGGETMGDHEGGASAHHFVERRIDLGFGDGIERAGRLVED